jgi:hypothetical protein
VDLNQDFGAPFRNLHRIVAVQVFIGIDGGIAGYDAAAIEVFRYVSADETGIFIRITVLRAWQSGNTSRRMMGYTDDDIKPRALFYN